MPDLKYIDIAEFHRLGFIQEINRRLLHPCGLALSVHTDDNGNATGFGPVWDDRDDPEGWLFTDLSDEDSATKAAPVDALIAQHTDHRQSTLGFVVQPIGHSFPTR